MDELIDPTPAADTVLSVTEVTRQVRMALEDRFGEVRVSGEISNLRMPGSGHYYFTLKDAGATLNAVMFRGGTSRLGFVPKDGQAVIAKGRITVYEARGQYQILVDEMRPQGKGTLQEQFEALKRKLAGEGLFELERKRPLPVFPETVGIVTSLQGAVLQDFIRVLGRRAPGIRIQVRGVRVQGDGSAREIADAITAFNTDAIAEVIIVARGGGSLEDLWAFNEEVVARALADSYIPTVSAVGHETDFTIADFVADVRAPTPSVAAELICREWSEWREEVVSLRSQLGREAAAVLEERRQQVGRLRESYVFREPRRVVEQLRQRVDETLYRLKQELLKGRDRRRHQWETSRLRFQALHPAKEIERRRERVRQMGLRLRALSPKAVLERGYAMAVDENGKIIRDAVPGLKGKTARVMLAHGTLLTRVEAVEDAK